MPGHKTKLQLRHALLLAFLFLFRCELRVPTSFRRLQELKHASYLPVSRRDSTAFESVSRGSGSFVSVGLLRAITDHKAMCKAFHELNFHGARRVRKNRENYAPRKFTAIR